MGHYKRGPAFVTGLRVKRELVPPAEIESGGPGAGPPKAPPPVTAETVPQMLAQGKSVDRDVPVAARFKARQRVRARNINPIGHTRLPRYARGKLGIIERDHGVFVFPDTNAHFLGEKPQHLYSVRFAARELWGDAAAPRDAVYVDLFEDYLEPI